MEAINIKLDFIMANPWQPRMSEDAEHIKKLAISIAEDGLMQVPVGRLVDVAGQACSIDDAFKMAPTFDSVRDAWRYLFEQMGCQVQLAFGHSRLAAYKWLRDVRDYSDILLDFSTMPVKILDLTDEEMFRMAISENLQRKDLNPIEEARAMEHYRDDFHKTSAEIGELFGLAESSVRNKMRLLGLPAEIQEAAGQGKISEGSARELLSFYDLPENLQKSGESVAINTNYGMQHTSIVRQALGGMPADQVRDVITALIRQSGRELSRAKWKWDAAYDKSLDERIVSETCQACPLRIQREKNWYCLSNACWNARVEINTRALLAKASAATGIRPAEDLSRGWHEYVRLEEDSAAEIRASGCDHLRLVATEAVYTMQRRGMMVEGHPGVGVMCDRRNGQCVCANGIAARAKLKAAGIRVEQPVSGKPAQIHVSTEKATLPEDTQLPASNEALTQRKIGNADELKELASQARRASKQMREEVKAMQEDFTRRVIAAFDNRNPRVLAELLLYFVYSTERYKFAQASAEEIIYKAAMHFAEATYDLTNYNTPNLDVAISRFNEILKSANLQEMTLAAPDEPVYEPVEPMVLGWERNDPQTGKTLVEVFDEGQPADHFPGQKPGETLMDYFARTEA